MRPAITASLFVFGCTSIWAQDTGAKPEFEVASVKPLVSSSDGRIRIMVRGGPGTDDPSRVTYEGLSLKDFLSTAYAVKTYQISGPGWLDTERYSIMAKIPEGTTKEQFNLMLQNLLAERFQIKLHREQKEFPLYELSVGKNGPKLKAAAAADPNAAADPGPPRPLAPGKDGFPQLPPGRPNMAAMINQGRLRLAATMQPISRLADMLANSLGSPVVDKTGLTGDYDFTLEFAPEPGQGPFGALPPPPPPPANGGDFGPKVADSQGEAPSLMAAIQEQLGLKLEKKRGPLDVLVIDHAEKTPTEN